MWRNRFGVTSGARAASQQPRVTQERGAAVARDRLQRGAPVGRQRGHEHLARDRVPHQLEQLVAESK